MVTPRPSFIEIAPESHFSLQNLPYGIFRPNDGPARTGVAIGDLVLDLAVLEEAGFFHTLTFGERAIFARDSLNGFLALGRPVWRRTREILQHLLAADTATLRDDEALRVRAFQRQAEVTMQLPAGDRHTHTREFLEAQIAILMGGRVAEEMFLRQTTSGAGSD